MQAILLSINLKSNQNIQIQKIRIQKIFKIVENLKTKFVFSFGMMFITLLFWAIWKTVLNADNIKSSNMIAEEMYEIEISIIIAKNLATYEFDSFVRGYHAYMDIWNPRIGEVLKCKREPTNDADKHAVAIMRSNSLGKE